MAEDLKRWPSLRKVRGGLNEFVGGLTGDNPLDDYEKMVLNKVKREREHFERAGLNFDTIHARVAAQTKEFLDAFKGLADGSKTTGNADVDALYRDSASGASSAGERGMSAAASAAAVMSR